jgi:NAD-dependent SIR2 family protein deacetylase
VDYQTLGGNEGFWEAYPPIKELGLDFEDMANPIWFERDPKLAWAFYGHRLHLYRDTIPHQGFQLLLSLVKQKENNYFIYTSNVDGQFQKAGFDKDKIVEIHGSIQHIQCSGEHKGINDANEINIEIEDDKFQAVNPPLCKKCRKVLRPNILMFGDWGWDNSRTNKQELRFNKWMKSLHKNTKKLLIIEIGAGKHIPTIRVKSQTVAKKFKTQVIRINPRDHEIEQSLGIGLKYGALEGLNLILQ